MNTHSRIKQLLIAMIALLAGHTWATDLYVSPTGSETGGTTWSTAYKNLQNALQAAASGTTIHMAGGIYSLTDQITWTSSLSGVTVRGGYGAAGDEVLPGDNDPTQWPTIVTTAGTIKHRLFMLSGVQDVSIENITFTGARNVKAAGADARGAALAFDNCLNIRMSNCVISNNHAETTGSGTTCQGGGLYVSDSRLTLIGCLLDGNTVKSAGGSSSVGGAVAYDANSVCTFVNCVFKQNMLLGAANNCLGGAVYQSGSATMGTFQNCLMVGNVALPPGFSAANGDGVYCNDGSLSMTNCTVAYNTGDGVYRKAGTVRLANSIVYGHVDDLVGTVSLDHCLTGDGDNAGNNGCLQGDPDFTHGFYLAAGSPARDAGDQPVAGTIFTNLTTLVAGTFDSGTVDLGYHYNTAAPLIPEKLYVATTGSDANDGLTDSAPLKSITKALALAGDQTVIQIALGRYSTGTTGETFPLALNRRYGLEMIGAPDGGTIIDATGSNMRVMTALDCGGLCFSNLIFTGGHETSALGVGIYGGGVRLERIADTIISHCQITNNFCNKAGGAQNHAYGGGLAIGVCADVTVENTVVSGNRTFTNWGYTYGEGVCILDRCRVLLNHSRLTDNYGTTPCNGNLGGGLYISGTRTTTQVKNCLIARNSTVKPKGQGDGVYVTGAAVSLQNCTIAYNCGYGLYRKDGTVSLKDSILWGNGDDINGSTTLLNCNVEDGDSVGASGCISQDPKFKAGFYLATDSLSVDHGSATAASLGMDTLTTQTDGTLDRGLVDLGYHHDAGAGTVIEAFYVAPTGSDTANTGLTAGSPFRTISHALAVSQDGTQIFIAPGQYDTASGESFPLYLEGRQSIGLRGTGSGVVIDALGAQSRVFQIKQCGNLILEGLTLANGSPATSATIYGGGLLAIGASGLGLTECTLVNNRLAGKDYAYGAGIALQDCVATLDGCLFIGNEVYNSNRGHGAGLAFVDCASCDVNTTIISNNFIQSGGYQNGAGFYHATGVARLRNCLIAGNWVAKAGYPGGLQIDSGTVTCESSTITDNPNIGIKNEKTGASTLLNCIVWDNGINVTNLLGTFSASYCNIGDYAGAGSNGNLSQDPMFRAPEKGDYTLLSASPSVDTGLAQAWMATSTDLAGNARLIGHLCDMGCYECTIRPGTTLILR